jgi:MscS family membrane protein
LIGFYYAITELKISNATLDTIEKILISIGIFLISLFVIYLFDLVILEWARKWASRTKSSVDDQVLNILSKFSRIFFILLAVLFILQRWGIQIGPLLASLGIAGVAVAFALQSTLGNIFGGISLIVDKTIKVGDRIELDAQTTGIVTDVGLRSTKIRTFDNEIITIPNGKFADSQIKNIVNPDPSLRVVIPFSVAYGTKIEKVKDVVTDCLKDIEGIKNDPPVYIRFSEMANSALIFKAYFWVDHYKKAFSAKEQANINIYNALNKARINIPFPQMDVWLRK